MPALEQIGRYRVERRLGAGAFAVVWLAHDDRLQAPVAVKVMAENWACRTDIRERFLAEARALRKATSGNVVQVFDIGDLPDDRPYFVMEYADGGTLEDRVTAGPVDVREALRITVRAARGVAALHEAGVVHRDIKPSNVLLAGGSTGSGPERVLVADLGLAKNLAQASGLTVVAGSVGYMAPEQAEPFDGIDGRADVYSLGAVLHHLVTGSVPGPPGKVLRPDEVLPGPPRAVGDAVQRAMEPDRERRWPTATAFADELDRLAEELAGESAGERQPEARQAPDAATAPGPASRRTPDAARSADAARTPDAARSAAAARPRRRTRTVVVAAAVVALLAGGAVVTTLNQDAPPATQRVSDATDRISFEIPADWARQTVDSGWDPSALGLQSRSAPGVTVAEDVRRWQDLTAPVSGVFVGIGDASADNSTGTDSDNAGSDNTGGDSDLVSRVAAIDHASCTYAGSRTFSSAAWHGRMRTWSSCGTDGQTLEEIGLTPTRNGAPQVYAQIRCDEDCTDRTDKVLRSLRVAGS